LGQNRGGGPPPAGPPPPPACDSPVLHTFLCCSANEGISYVFVKIVMRSVVMETLCSFVNLLRRTYYDEIIEFIKKVTSHEANHFNQFLIHLNIFLPFLDVDFHFFLQFCLFLT
jgi:hypothetical protein